MPVDQAHGAPARNQRELELENTGSYDVPSYGICEITDVYRPEKGAAGYTPGAGRVVYKVTRPTEDAPCAHIHNKHCPIPVGDTKAYGGASKVGTLDYPTLALLAQAPDEVGQGYGIKEGDFRLHKGLCGYVFVGDWDGEKGFVIRRDNCEKEEYVRAVECSLVGEPAKAQPQRWNATTCKWEDDPNKAQVTVDDPMCQRLAFGTSATGDGDIYKVERPGASDCSDYGSGGDCNYAPSAPYGLTRRIKITSEVECNAIGYGKLLVNTTEGCTWTEPETDCLVPFCNTSNRSLACDADEEATVHHHPGDCIGWVVPNARPLYATAEANANSCADKTDVPILNIQYKDVCNWTTRATVETVNNPAGIYFCKTDTLILNWNDATCGWDVANVEDHVETVVYDIVCEDDDVCGLWIKAKQVATHSCCEVTSTSIEIPTETVTVFAGAGGDDSGNPYDCSLQFGTYDLCILGCVKKTVGTNANVQFYPVKVMTEALMTWDTGNLQIDLDKTYTYVYVLCSSAAAGDNDFVQFYDCTTAAPTTSA